MKTASLVLAVWVGTGGCGDTPREPGPPRASIEYIAHAAFRIEAASGASVLIDPYGSRIWIGYDWPPGVAADAIFVSHPHYDHDAGVSRGLAFPWDSTTTPLHRSPGTYRVGDITVHGLAGKHADPYGHEFGQINTVWVVEVGGVRIVHWGDNGPLTDRLAGEILARGPVDVVMLPIDATYHIIDQETIDDIVARLTPGWLVPMHYAIPALEPGNGPEDLGPIAPWLAGRPGVERLASHQVGVSPETVRGDLRNGDPRIVVFEPSPAIATR